MIEAPPPQAPAGSCPPANNAKLPLHFGGIPSSNTTDKTNLVNMNSSTAGRHFRGRSSSGDQYGDGVSSTSKGSSRPHFTPPQQSRTSCPLTPSTNKQFNQNRMASSPKHSPPTSKMGQPPQQPTQLNRQSPPKFQRIVRYNKPELKIKVRNLPANCDTSYIFNLLGNHGNIVRIEILELRPQDRKDQRIAYITFKPPPRDDTWITRPYKIESGGETRFIYFDEQNSEPFLRESPIDRSRKFEDKMAILTSSIGFGVMETENSMLEFVNLRNESCGPQRMILDLQYKCVDIEFTISYPAQPPEYPKPMQRLFKLRVNLPQIKSIVKMREASTGQIAFVLTTNMPPQLYRKTDNLVATHKAGASYWNDSQTFYRQTGISKTQDMPRNSTIQLQKTDDGIDVGRWLTYRFVFSAQTAASKDFQELCEALHHHSITAQTDQTIAIRGSRSEHLWNWLDNPKTVSEDTSGTAALLQLHQMAKQTIQLPFEVRYQLEACISSGVLNECNIDNDFLLRLYNLERNKPVKEESEHQKLERQRHERERAVKLLEKVSAEKERIFNPMEIFPRFLHQISVVRKRVPVYCASIRSATITPTTVYFSQPIVEISNSIVRKYQYYEDRFLRVKFSDEKYKAKIMSSDDSSMNEVFTRIKRAMTNGINVGGRQYEFLAFGNSQFREGGAYFFASTAERTAQDIRNAMGDFSRVERTVAKYCARVGQAFTTTRPLRLNVRVEEIPDIERNGYCFTDGVGKISPFLAHMIAHEHGWSTSSTDCPSVFQFRYGGCKGVLAVDPSLTGTVMQIRPSQRKFEIPNQPLGLDICRISQFSEANLNLQIILILSALGIDDKVFLRKMDHELREISTAMTDEVKALELLQRRIDQNQMTVQLAQMTLDGFMETKDPFMISCLRLWRAWRIKYLKEKAQINIEEGAFVLGCVDEKVVLKGHFEKSAETKDETMPESSLPEIFLRVEQPPGTGNWTVITGVCIVARNPSLHPGDIRVVRAVDKPELYHHKNCVVFPQTGDRDIANMCSGGDLDGDDFLVIWDKDLLPLEWNYPAMNFKGAEPKESDGPVTVDDMTSFFVTYMKYDNLSQIAVAHRYWADALPDGVKDPKCLELAMLHSTAVDYVKTGVPAKMPRHLRINRWPHWAEVKGKPGRNIYRSNKVLGKLYDFVQRVDMQPAWDFEFDSRILTAYELDYSILDLARKAKQEYDAAILGIMAKYSIKTEFEVWTTFVMEHSNEFGDYKFFETIGEESQILKDHHVQLCLELAETNKNDEDHQDKISRFVAAMYTVTKQELDAALEECRKVKVVRGVQVPLREKTAATMPFISFPWLLPRELGVVATKGSGPKDNLQGHQPIIFKKPHKPKKAEFDALGDFMPEPLAEVATSRLLLPSEVKLGTGLEIRRDSMAPTADGFSRVSCASDQGHQPGNLDGGDRLALQDLSIGPNLLSSNVKTVRAAEVQEMAINASSTHSSPAEGTGGRVADIAHREDVGVGESVVEEAVTSLEETEASDEEVSEANVITIDVKKSAFDKLEEMMGL